MTTTVSRVLMNGEAAELLMETCRLVRNLGGAFSIDQEWASNDWYATFTIHWPDRSLVTATSGGSDGNAD